MICLTRIPKETYYQYTGRLLDNTQNKSELVQIKLADRLDNTLDMRIELEDPLLGIDFFRNIYQLMFVKNYKGYVPDDEHPPPPLLNGARRLYQLFKNTVLRSLIRQNFADTENETLPDGQQLLDGLFSSYFAHSSKKTLNQKLDQLYGNKPLMIQASIAFIVIFLSFLNDSTHYVSGISAEGIAPA